MSSIVVKINFKEKEHLSEKIFTSIKQDLKTLLKDNPEMFVSKADNIYINYNIDLDKL